MTVGSSNAPAIISLAVKRAMWAPNGVRLSCGATFEHAQTYDSSNRRRRQLQAQVRLALIDSHRHLASPVHALARALLGNLATPETNALPRQTPRPRPDARARRLVCC